jgi:hypothetical protein
VDVMMVLIAKMLTWHIKVNYMKKLCFIINMSLEDISSVLKWETCLLISWKSCAVYCLLEITFRFCCSSINICKHKAVPLYIMNDNILILLYYPFLHAFMMLIMVALLSPCLPTSNGITCVNTLRTGDANLRHLRFLHYNCERQMTQICLLTCTWFLRT